MHTRRILLATVASIAPIVLGSSVALAVPITIPDGVKDVDPLPGQGTGLCVASAISSNPVVDFNTNNPAAYTGALNAFIEVHKPDRVESVIRTLLDLSNNNASGLKLSFGDFTNAMLPDCKEGGCDFFVNDTTTSFGSRVRGFFNVTSALAGKPIHFGFYTDDSVSLTFFDSQNTAYTVISRAPTLGAATWRITETVTFTKPGLYPIEILYTEITEHAALEMSYLVDDPTFVDFERAANAIPIVNLKDAGFTLFPPTDFFQTLSGNPSYPDLNACKQCDRQWVNKPGNNGCDASYYCNEAALCAPCDTGSFCGPTCSPCGIETPHCINLNGTVQCVACVEDKDCANGFSCNPITKTCDECNENSDCPKGEACLENKCEPCATSAQCAGNSCNCCPNGANGKQMNCAPLETDGDPLCVECTSSADCNGRLCNLAVGRCVDTLPDNQTPTCCGDTCVNCLQLGTIIVDGQTVPQYPYCLPGPIGTACAECRSDMDCAKGAFCLSDVCTLCTRDKRCGLRCDSCGGDTPYCFGQSGQDAACVRCVSDDQCPSGKCDTVTHECGPADTCNQTCGPTTPYCDGSACVACYADSHCPCGGTCDQASKTCVPSCKTNVDCLGDEHCRWNEVETNKECALGPMPDGVDCGGTLATICSARPGRHGGGAPSAFFAVFSVLALLYRRRLMNRVGGEP